ncbi:MAG: hypothetical protein NZ455_02025 [Bacteroidia bacterium]|nr:hypothetical protein [Bacteroidia bacterium]
MRRVREQCEAQRSTEAIAQPAARRPCGHERSETPTRTRPKNKKSGLSKVYLERYKMFQKLSGKLK